jgi:hypothetical protein
MRNPRHAALGTTLLLAFLCMTWAGCGPRASQYIREDVDFSFIRRVAVFPFYNLTQDTFAAQRVQSIFVTEVLKTGQVEVADRGETLSIVASMKLPPDRVISPEQVMELGKTLQVDGIFFATIEEYGTERSARDPAQVVTAVYQLHETQTGRMVWSSQTRTDGTSLMRKLFGGGTAGIYDVARANVRAALETLF